MYVRCRKPVFLLYFHQVRYEHSDHKGTAAMIQIAAVPFNFSYLKALDFRGIFFFAGSKILKTTDSKGNLLIFGFILCEKFEPIRRTI